MVTRWSGGDKLVRGDKLVSLPCAGVLHYVVSAAACEVAQGEGGGHPDLDVEHAQDGLPQAEGSAAPLDLR